MSEVIKYKGYYSIPKYDAEAKCFHGMLEGIRDYVDYICFDASEIEKEFHDAVDDYLETCAEWGKEPNKPYTGQFNVRISPEDHRDAVYYSVVDDTSLNSIVSEAVHEYVDRRKKAEKRATKKSK